MSANQVPHRASGNRSQLAGKGRPRDAALSVHATDLQDGRSAIEERNRRLLQAIGDPPPPEVGAGGRGGCGTPHPSCEGRAGMVIRRFHVRAGRPGGRIGRPRRGVLRLRRDVVNFVEGSREALEGVHPDHPTARRTCSTTSPCAVPTSGRYRAASPPWASHRSGARSLTCSLRSMRCLPCCTER